jgi:predicted nucleic acid-binding protein
VIAVDSSVVVAGFGAWHEHHSAAREALRERPGLPAHAALEAYSVLTRLPDPHRADAVVVAEFLRRQFGPRRLVLPAREHAALPGRLAAWGITGGAVYDALIGLTAAAAGAELHSLDARAKATYARCGVSARLLTA